jgi:hypothetical protein
MPTADLTVCFKIYFGAEGEQMLRVRGSRIREWRGAFSPSLTTYTVLKMSRIEVAHGMSIYRHKTGCPTIF